MNNINNGTKTFEELIKELVVTHKNLMAYKYPADLCAIYAHHAKSFTMREYIPITVKVRNDPMSFLSLDNKYFCDFQRISELMGDADKAFREKMGNPSDLESDKNIKVFRASLVAKASNESKAYYAKVGAMPNTESGRTTNPNKDGK